MSDGYRLIVTPRAGRDVEELHDHIAQQSPQGAAGMVTAILDALEQVRQFPTAPSLDCGMRDYGCPFAPSP